MNKPSGEEEGEKWTAGSVKLQCFIELVLWKNMMGLKIGWSWNRTPKDGRAL